MKTRLMNIYNAVKNYVGKHKIISGVIIIIIIIAGILTYRAYANTGSTPKYVLSQVTMGNLVSTVTGTGQVSAEDQVDIKPQGSTQSTATYTEIDVKQGDTVKAGQLIAAVSNTSAATALTQAKASLASAQANYNKVINGPDNLTLEQYQLAVSNAQSSLLNSIRSAYSSVDDALRSDIDPLYQNPRSPSPNFSPSYFDSSTGQTISFQIADSNLSPQLSLERETINTMMTTWETAINNVDSNSPTDISSLADLSSNNATQVRAYVDDIVNGINTLYAGGTKYSSTVDTFKSNAASARSSINSVVNSISSSKQSLASANLSLTQQVAPPTDSDLASAQASLTNSQASYDNAVQNYDQGFLRAPFDGIVADVNASVGDQANTSTAVATIITKDQLANITLNEVDAAKVQLGDQVAITFDAIPGLTVMGTTSEIDTIGTVTQGVVNYSAKISFDTQDARVKPGMSVSVVITTATENNVLLVPSAAIKTTAGRSYVQELPVSGTSTSAQNATGSSTGAANQYRRNRTATATSTNGFATGNAGQASSTTSTTSPQASGTFGTGGSARTAFARTQSITTSQTPTQVPITIGDSNDTYTVVTGGLKAGDWIITQTVSGTATKSAATTATTRTTTGFGGGAAGRGGAAAGGLGRAL